MYLAIVWQHILRRVLEDGVVEWCGESTVVGYYSEMDKTKNSCVKSCWWAWSKNLEEGRKVGDGEGRPWYMSSRR